MASSNGKSETPPKARQRKPWIIGAIVGVIFWGTALLSVFAFEASEKFAPDWVVKLDLPDTLGSICAIFAVPVIIFGFAFIWGDDPPYAWLNNIAFNIGFAVVLYGTIGALVGNWIGSERKWQFSVRALLIAITIIAILLGTLVILIA
jgi:hypothetical protein